MNTDRIIVFMNNKTYDITDFKHPGTSLTKYNNKDISSKFKSVRMHKICGSSINEKLKTMEVGGLCLENKSKSKCNLM